MSRAACAAKLGESERKRSGPIRPTGVSARTIAGQTGRAMLFSGWREGAQHAAPLQGKREASRCRIKSRVESTQLTEKSHHETDKTDRADDS